MDDARLNMLIDDLRGLPAETEWVEFKENNLDPERLAKTTSALANAACLAGHEHGYLVWGIRDGDHAVVGTSFEPATEKKGNELLQFWLAKALSPSPTFRFHTTTRPEGRVVVLEIPAARTVPVKYADIPYIRVGSATPKLSDYPEREADLLNKLRPFIWEAGVAASFLTEEQVLEALDYQTFFTLLGQKLPSSPSQIMQRLAEERLIARDVGDRWNVLNLGAILVGRRLEAFPEIARKAFRVVQYEGASRRKTLKSREGVRGYAAGFSGMLKFIDDLLPSEERIEDGIRSEHRTYPEIALRELIANALVHQDMTISGTGPIVEIFSDRVEIGNPGVPVNDMVRKLFGAPPRSRNEQMARLMRRMGMCEELGSGLVKVVEATEEYRLPAPIFRIVDGSTRVILYGPKPFSALDRSQRVQICYQHACLMFHEAKKMTNATLRERFGIEDQNAAQVSRVIREALDEGFIVPADPERPKAGYVPFWAG
jgi:predicted HTH transcriptional regulator